VTYLSKIGEGRGRGHTLISDYIVDNKNNTNDFLQSSRISDSNKLNRDLLIYLLWSTGWYNNQEIGNLFGLGYSSVSRRVTIMKSEMSGEDEMNNRLEIIKSLIKV